MNPASITRAPSGSSVELAYETFGDPAARPVLLVMGLAMQMLGWPSELCEALAERGHFVIRFDNRDVGLSTHLDDAPRGDVAAVITGDRSTVAYSLSDMAEDALGLLDQLKLASAHIVGASMGAAIAQHIAIEHRRRVLSLTSMMGSTGSPKVGLPTPQAISAVLAPPGRTRVEVIERAVKISRALASPGFPFDEKVARERAAASFERRYDPAGVSRQLVAVLSQTDRTSQLNSLQLPTLVVHGTDDPLVNVSGGRATAKAIPKADLVLIPGMGHDLPRGVWPQLLDCISSLTEKAEARQAG